MRYLGGGIGHLEQFPPASNDNEAMHEHEDNQDEAAGRGSGAEDIGEDRGDVDDDEGDENGEDGENDEDDVDEDGEMARHGGYSDPGESSDEDMGNSY